MDLAIKVVSIALGIVAAVASYPYLNRYMLAILAFIVCIAVGFLVFVLVERVLNYIFANTRV